MHGDVEDVKAGDVVVRGLVQPPIFWIDDEFRRSEELFSRHLMGISIDVPHGPFKLMIVLTSSSRCKYCRSSFVASSPLGSVQPERVCKRLIAYAPSDEHRNNLLGSTPATGPIAAPTSRKSMRPETCDWGLVMCHVSE